MPGSPAVNTGGPVTALDSTQPMIAAGDTILPVADAAAIAGIAGSDVIQIDQEQMLVTSVDVTANTLTVQRGYNGTMANSHAGNAGVFLATDQSGQPRVVNGQTSIGRLCRDLFRYHATDGDPGVRRRSPMRT